MDALDPQEPCPLFGQTGVGAASDDASCKLQNGLLDLSV
jgi:hypothetical protein